MLTVCPYGDAPYDVWPDQAGGLVTLGRNEVFDADFVTVVQQSFIHPSRCEDIDIASGRRSLRHVERIVGVDPDAYVQERHLAPASDGTEVPVVVVRRRDVDLDGTAAALPVRLRVVRGVHGPRLRLRLVALTALAARPRRGVRVRPAPRRRRDGSALVARRPFAGEAQHLRRPGGRRRFSRRRACRRHSDRDPRAVGRWLAAGRAVLTAPRALRRGGRRGALRRCGHHHADPSLPLTIPEWDEWGNPADPDDYAVMVSYSPVDNPPPVDARPALLVTGAVHDTRVLVREPAKWVATLRASDPDHGAGVDPTSACVPAHGPLSRRDRLRRPRRPCRALLPTRLRGRDLRLDPHLLRRRICTRPKVQVDQGQTAHLARRCGIAHRPGPDHDRAEDDLADHHLGGLGQPQ